MSVNTAVLVDGYFDSYDAAIAEKKRRKSSGDILVKIETSPYGVGYRVRACQASLAVNGYVVGFLTGTVSVPFTEFVLKTEKESTSRR